MIFYKIATLISLVRIQHRRNKNISTNSTHHIWTPKGEKQLQQPLQKGKTEWHEPSYCDLQA